MPLSADTLLDRLYLKSQITRWRLLAIIFAAVAAFALFGGIGKPSKIGRSYIARITFDGIISDDRDVYDLIDSVADNNNVKAVILWVDTPGGSAVGGEETYNHIKALAARKPVVSVMRSVAASAGYMISIAADRVFAREGTITGSIGVIIEAAEFTELAEKLGIKPIVVKSSDLKGTLSPLEKATPASIAVVQQLIDDFYSRFVDMVASSRGIARDQVVKLADGRVYSGKRAVELKLIDAIGGEAEALNWLETQKKVPKDLDIIDESNEPELSFLDEVSQSMFGKFFQNSRIRLDGLAAIWHPQLN